jgi:hypothetical protein
LMNFLELMTWNSGLTRCSKAHKVGETQVRVLQVSLFFISPNLLYVCPS